MEMLKRIENEESIPLFIALSLILKGHTRFFEKKLEGTGVTPSELPYILKIYADDGILTQRDLSDIFGVSEPVVARTLKNLESKGFVNRTNDPKNKTRRLLFLTERGFEITGRMFNINDEWLDEIFKDMNPKDRDKFDEVIRLLTINSLKL